MAAGALDVAPLLTSRHSFADAPKIYDDLRRPGAFGLVIEYAVPNESLARTLPGVDWLRITPAGFTPKATAAIKAVLKRYGYYGVRDKDSLRDYPVDWIADHQFATTNADVLALRELATTPQ